VAPYAIAAVLLVGLAAGVLAIRRLTGRREDVRQTFVVGESPRQALDRVEAAAGAFRGYASERRGWELVLFRRHQGPLGFFEDPDGFMAEATMDILHVSARHGEAGTEVVVRGRCEPRVAAAVLRALAEAPPA
jgi:hypothetical protein